VPQLASSAYATPPEASTSLTGPGVVWWVHVRPASCVDHNCGPNAQPSFFVAKRTFETAGLGPLMGAGNGATRDQLAPPSLVDASIPQELVAQVLEVPRTKPWVAETKVTEAGSKPASASAGSPDGGPDGAPVGGGTEDGAEAVSLADATADVAGAAGDETAGAVDAAGVLAGALLAAVECVLLEQPAAATSATSVMPAARVVHEVVMRSRTQDERFRVHVSRRSFRRRQSKWIQFRAAARR
jgi:hypothetical protein